MPHNHELHQLAEKIAADLLADGVELRVLTKKGKHTATWFKSNLTNAISNQLHQHIELIKL